MLGVSVSGGLMTFGQVGVGVAVRVAVAACVAVAVRVADGSTLRLVGTFCWRASPFPHATTLPSSVTPNTTYAETANDRTCTLSATATLRPHLTTVPSLLSAYELA